MGQPPAPACVQQTLTGVISQLSYSQRHTARLNQCRKGVNKHRKLKVNRTEKKKKIIQFKLIQLSENKTSMPTYNSSDYGSGDLPVNIEEEETFIIL